MKLSSRLIWGPRHSGSRISHLVVELGGRALDLRGVQGEDGLLALLELEEVLVAIMERVCDGSGRADRECVE